jgi:hypothetical protein
MPYAIGGIILLGLLLASKAAGASSGSGNEVFRDYAWIQILPSVLNTLPSPLYIAGGGGVAPGASPPLPGGGGAITNLNLPPPPGAAPGSGNWHVYPNGNAVAYAPNTGGGRVVSNTVEFTSWPNVPPGYDLYQWIPLILGPHGTPTKLNGYWVATWPWHIVDTGIQPIGMTYAPLPWKGMALPPPPSGETPSSGKWVMKHPGYLVWLTPSNVNEADAVYLYGAGSTPMTAPGAGITPEAQWTPGGGIFSTPTWSPPPPSPTPVATTH